MENKRNEKRARIMPHNIEAEQAVLGCNLIDNDIAVDIMAKLKVEDFYTTAHQTIFDAMLNIYKKNNPIDFVTITDELEKQGAMESVGGIDYIATLTNIVPSAANYTHYVEIVKRDSLLRRLIKASEEVIKEAYEGENKEDTLNFAEKKIFDISQSEDSSSLVAISGPVTTVIDKLDEIAKNKGEISGIPTGFKSFDKLTNGLHEGELIIIAARPGVGKTSFAMNIVNHAAVECGKVCAVFSLEMPKEQLAQRSMFSISGVNMAKGLKGNLDKDEYKAIWAAGKKLSDSKLYVDDTSSVTPIEIISKCRRLKREHGLDLIMIDYLQLMNGMGKYKDSSRQLEISELTRNLKIAAKELGVPILLLSQLSRASEGRKDHRPILSDLRESGSIEQDADIVLFLHNPEKYNDVEVKEPGVVDLIVAKHRNGATEDIKLRWIGENTTYKDYDYKAETKSSNSVRSGEDVLTDADAVAQGYGGELATYDGDEINDMF